MKRAVKQADCTGLLTMFRIVLVVRMKARRGRCKGQQQSQKDRVNFSASESFHSFDSDSYRKRRTERKPRALTKRKNIAIKIPMKSSSRTCSTDIEGYIERAAELIRAGGGRMTDTRLAVLRCIASTKRPLHPKDVLERLSSGKTKASIDLVSIYRILEALEGHALVHQVLPNGGFFPCLHSRCQGEAHVLASCTGCEDTEELHLPGELGIDLFRFLRKTKHFTAKTPTIQIQGTCRNCSK